MTGLDRLAVKVCRLLPDRLASDALATYFLWRFRRRRPSMVAEVSFHDCGAALGAPPNRVAASWGVKEWGVVTRFQAEPFWLEEAETRRHIVAALADVIASDSSADEFIIDRSLIWGYGDPECRHPAFHASFSLWRKLKDDEVARIADCEVVWSTARIARNAVLYREEWL